MKERIKIKFGDVTAGEVDVMLEADASPIAAEILNARITTRDFSMTREQAEYLSNRMIEDAERVAEAVSDAAGRAFEKAGNRLAAIAKANPT